MPKVVFQDLGLIDYKEAWDYQEKRFNKSLMLRKTIERKIDKTLHYLTFFFANTLTYILWVKVATKTIYWSMKIISNLEERPFIKSIEGGTSPIMDQGR